MKPTEGMKMDVEDDPGTWAHTLKEHWKIFTDHTWHAFSVFEEETRKLGHENKVDKFKWREYLIWDMQRRHNEEIGIIKDEFCAECKNEFIACVCIGEENED